MNKIQIGNKEISNNSSTFIIAELSGNHGHEIETAKKTILAMKESGADAVKLQTYTPDTITLDSNNKCFQINHGTIWDGQNMYQLYKKAYTPWEWHTELKDYAENLGLIFFSAPFDFTAVDFLESLDVPIYKIASPEISDIPLIEYTASKGKPMIISTGIAKLHEIEDAVNACRRVGNENIILLKCTSSYPTPLEDVNLKTIPHMKELFNVTVGLSDHTLGTSVPISAVTLGAKVVEKHFILSKNIDSPDKAFSLLPEEFKLMVDSIRNVEKALGKVTYELTESMKVGRIGRRTLFAVKDIKKGEIITSDNVMSKRPGAGISPKYLNDIIGKKAKESISRATPIKWDLIEL